MRIPAVQQRWTPPAARLEGERTLKLIAETRRAADEPPAVKIKTATIEERLSDLERDIRELVADWPKVTNSGGGGKRMVAKVLARDFNISGALPAIHVGTTAPAHPQVNDLWVDTN